MIEELYFRAFPFQLINLMDEPMDYHSATVTLYIFSLKDKGLHLRLGRIGRHFQLLHIKFKASYSALMKTPEDLIHFAWEDTIL